MQHTYNWRPAKAWSAWIACLQSRLHYQPYSCILAKWFPSVDHMSTLSADPPKISNWTITTLFSLSHTNFLSSEFTWHEHALLACRSLVRSISHCLSLGLICSVMPLRWSFRVVCGAVCTANYFDLKRWEYVAFKAFVIFCSTRSRPRGKHDGCIGIILWVPRAVPIKADKVLVVRSIARHTLGVHVGA